MKYLLQGFDHRHSKYKNKTQKPSLKIYENPDSYKVGPCYNSYESGWIKPHRKTIYFRPFKGVP